MRVVVLLTDLFDAVGGIQTFNRALVKALDDLAAERAWQLEVLVLGDRGGSELRAAYLDPRHGYRAAAGNRRRFIAAALRAGARADCLVFGHVHFAPLALGLRAAEKYLVVHGIEVWKRLNVLQRLGVSRMRRVLSVSRFTQGEMAARNAVPEERFVLFPNTLDPCYGSLDGLRSRVELGIPPGPLLLSVCRLSPLERSKGIDTVLHALPAILAQHPDARYVVVGRGDDRKRLSLLARELGVGENVQFAGSVSEDDLPSYYHQCDLFILPGAREGFGIVFLEAMRFAKACIGARAGGVPEVVEENVTGLLVEPRAAAHTAHAVQRLLRDDALRQRLGLAGRERLEREFSFEAFRTRLDAALPGQSAAQERQERR